MNKWCCSEWDPGALTCHVFSCHLPGTGSPRPPEMASNHCSCLSVLRADGIPQKRHNDFLFSFFQPGNDLCSSTQPSKGSAQLCLNAGPCLPGKQGMTITDQLGLPFQSLGNSCPSLIQDVGGQTNSIFLVPCPCEKSYNYLPPWLHVVNQATGLAAKCSSVNKNWSAIIS